MESIMAEVPSWELLIIVGIFGLIIGSFLNVFLYRFHTGKSLAGHSHCLSCATPLKPYDLVPLFSYLFLRGRCRTCGSYIPVRYFIVEAFTATLFVISLYMAASFSEFILLVAVSILGILIITYDIRHFIIPDEFTLALTLVAVINLVFFSWQQNQYNELVLSFTAALASVAFFYFLWFVSKGRWIGFGDVKLVFPLSLLVGPTFTFSLVVYSFWIGAAVSLILIGLGKLQRGKLLLHLPIRNLTIKSVVPFAPFLIAACLLLLFTKYDVLNIFSFTV